MEEVRIRVYRTPSFPTTIATKRVWRLHHLRCYMIIGVNPVVLQEDWRTEGFWTRHIARSREINLHGERKLVDCAVKLEEICRP
jgi:hypothetical protein